MSLVQMSGAIWVTPGEARDEQESVNTAVANLDRDIASSSAPASFRAAWSAFKAEWDSFYADQGGITGWFGRFATGGPYAKTVDYRGQLRAWEDRFRQLGGQPAGPGLVPPPAPGNALKYLAITAGVLAGLWVAHTAYREIRRVRGVVSA